MGCKLVAAISAEEEIRNGDNNHNVATYDDHSVRTVIREARLNPNAGGWMGPWGVERVPAPHQCQA